MNKAIALSKSTAAGSVSAEVLELLSNLSLEKIEQLMRDECAQTGAALDLRIAGTLHPGLLNDIWATIAIGTLCRNKRVTAIPAGLGKLEMEAAFTRSLHGMTALHSADRCRADRRDGEKIAAGAYVVRIKHANGRLERRGSVLDPTSTLMEFDPSPTIPVFLRGRGDKLNTDLLARMAETFSAEQSFAMRQESLSSEESIKKKELITFFKELYLNSYEYARNPVRNGATVPSVRLLQLRYFNWASAGSTEQAVEGHPPELRDYVRRVRRDFGTTAFLRLLASDFGDGILDYFLSTERGSEHLRADRTELLLRLIHTPLSSKRRTGAGRGLMDVVEAASGLNAFLSLRTNAHWLGCSFLNGPSDREQRLKPMQTAPVPKVVGAHWQILWPIRVGTHR